MKSQIIITLLIVATLSCKAQENLKEFYYLSTNKTETKVYKYVDKNDPTKTEYWKVKTIPELKKIMTTSYDSDFNIYNTFDEVITENGAELIAYSDFEINENEEIKEIKATVIDKDVFKWNGEKKYVYSVKYVNKYGRFEFKKTREEIGPEKIIVNGKTYDAIKFKGTYDINAIDYNDRYGFYQYSFYVKEIGMIKYERKIPVQDQLIELELTDILTEKEFEKIKASR